MHIDGRWRPFASAVGERFTGHRNVFSLDGVFFPLRSSCKTPCQDSRPSTMRSKVPVLFLSPQVCFSNDALWGSWIIIHTFPQYTTAFLAALQPRPTLIHTMQPQMLLAFCTQRWWPAWRAGHFNLFHGLSMLETTEIVDSEVSAILDARQVRHPAGRRMAIQIVEREEHGKNLEMILLFEEGIHCHRPVCVI